MTDLDAIISEIERSLQDLKKRLTRLERLAEKPPVVYGGPITSDMKSLKPPERMGQWCECGRDGCRWPYCKAVQNNCGNDPLGR